MQKVTREKLARAKELRREMTPAEKILWHELRGYKFRNLHFRRQQVIQGFIVDYYCHALELVIEVDGDIHDLHQEEDANRTQVLSDLGLTVLRFRNEEVVRDLSGVLTQLSKHVENIVNNHWEASPNRKAPLPLREGAGG